jgi:hypothetical protein
MIFPSSVTSTRRAELVAKLQTQGFRYMAAQFGVFEEQG